MSSTVKVGRFWSVAIGDSLKLANNADFTPPAIAHARAEFAGGGMTGKVNPSLGLIELMQSPIVFSDYDPEAAKLAGFVPGVSQPLLLRREFHEPRTGKSTVEIFRMLAQADIEFGAWERTSQGNMTVNLHIFSMRWMKGSEVIYHIDPEYGIFEGAGVNQIKEAMALIGAG
jgi:P2 family phage contractile tail tube protein